MKILVIQNRMGIGDTVIFLPYIKALSKKFNSPISLLVKESSKADQYLQQTDYIDKILLLERDKKTNNRHGGFFGSLNLIKEIKKNKSWINFLTKISKKKQMVTHVTNKKFFSFDSPREYFEIKSRFIK